VRVDDPAPFDSAGEFLETLWTQVLRAGVNTSPDALAAFERLACAYWSPLHACLRRQGANPAEAEGLTHSFLVHLVQKRVLQRLRRDKGRFRILLLTALRNHLRDERAKALAPKRGGGREHASLDEANDDGVLSFEPAGGPEAPQSFTVDFVRGPTNRIANRSIEDVRFEVCGSSLGRFGVIGVPLGRFSTPDSIPWVSLVANRLRPFSNFPGEPKQFFRIKHPTHR
jgi:hypothetical protein